MGTKHRPVDRKNILVSGQKVKRLQKLLQVRSVSEAVQVAVDRSLDAKEAIHALRRLQERGTWGRHLEE
ncbi:MAG: hypothetical protein IH977_15150 [Nitrospinae bacterium]|nr:hypothetical protein [Nitrospinota bacterium]